MRRRAYILFAVTFFAQGCGNPNARTVAVPSPPPPEWAKQPFDKWPQILLTNDAQFNGHTPLQGASAFLLRSSDGRVLAATTKHLIGEAGSVEPRIAPTRFGQVLASWRLSPRGRPETFVEVDTLLAPELIDETEDWLFFSLKPSQQLPAEPLGVRSEPIRVGEKVFLIGCPYVEEGCLQNRYEGIVTAKEHGTMFRYDLAPPVDLRGFSGAPILDESGLVVGTMTIWFEPEMIGEQYAEGGGQEIAGMLDIIESP